VKASSELLPNVLESRVDSKLRGTVTEVHDPDFAGEIIGSDGFVSDGTSRNRDLDDRRALFGLQRIDAFFGIVAADQG
jgi:hypothetical protein